MYLIGLMGKYKFCCFKDIALTMGIYQYVIKEIVNKNLEIEYSDKNIDIWLSGHDTFPEWPSSDKLKVKSLEAICENV